MRFVDYSEVQARLRGKRVAIVGSAPSVLDNDGGVIDGHDVVVRVNNYAIGLPPTGFRCDVYYSYFGGAIRKPAAELQRDGVTLCMCKCPNSQPLQSAWHQKHNKLRGIDFRYIYEMRRGWWFCDTFVPTDEHFMIGFELLGRHIPSTGFSAILDVLGCEPESVYLTGFDFFRSKIHNVYEAWREGDADDPIGHRPEDEFAWLVNAARRYPLRFDVALAAMVREARAA